MSQSVCPTRLKCQSAEAWKPNSDIAGLGVLIGFVGTGYLVFALLVVHYLVAYDPELPPPRKTPDDERLSQATSLEHLRANPSDASAANIVTRTDPMYWEPNPIDVNLLAWIRSRTAKLLVFLGASLPLVGQATSNHISRCFNTCVVAMCDVQIVTGMSILIGGFICLDENLSALHWQIITYLAWFSCVTHLSGLTVLRRYFQAHPCEKSLRITLMFILLVILIVSIVPTGFFNWRSPRADSSVLQATAASAKTSAACFYNLACARRLYQDSLWKNCTDSCDRFFYESDTMWSRELCPKRNNIGSFDCRWLAKSSAMQEMIVSTVLLFFGFVSRTIKLSTHFSSIIYRRVTSPVSTFILYCFAKVEDVVSAPDAHAVSRLQARTLLFEVWRGFVVRPLLAVIIFFSAHIDLFNSMLGELGWLLAILLWGTSKVLSAHYDEEYYTNKQQTNEETSTRWEFGQVLPILLLAAPLVAVLGTFTSAEKHSETAQSRDRLEIPNISFGSVPSSYSRPLQSDGDTWELTTLSTTGSRLVARRRPENDQSNDETNDADFSVGQDQGNKSKNVFARDYYRVALWMPPWITISFMMIWVYVFFLFWFATDVFLVEDPVNSNVEGKMSHSLDYLFNPTTGVFYLILESYPLAGHSFILAGLTADEWTNPPQTALGYFTQSALSWIFTLVTNTTFISFVYLSSGVEKEYQGNAENKDRTWLLGSIAGGLYGLYIFACLSRSAIRWIKLVARRRP